MEERALALHEQQVAALGALVHEPLGGARHVVGDHVVHRDAPAGDRHAGLAGGDVDRAQAALARRAVELERDHLLADHGVRADAVHHAHRGRAAVRALRHGEVGRRGAQVAQRHAGAGGGAAQLRVLGELSVQARPRRGARRRSPRAAPRARLGSSLPPVGATPTSSVVAPRSIASRRVATIGTSRRANGTTSTARAARLGRVDHRHHLARRRSGSRRAPSCRCARRTGPRRRSRAARSRRLDAQARAASRRQHAAVARARGR